MQLPLDTRAIAGRIREMIGPQHLDRLAETAERLGVPESALRLSVDRESPHPTLDVLAAIVRLYSVDPSWLVYGEYDERSLRRALDAGDGLSASDLIQLVVSRTEPQTRHQVLLLERRGRLDISESSAELG
jgi:hypothetical protein